MAAKGVHRDQHRGARLVEYVGQFGTAEQEVTRHANRTGARNRKLERDEFGVIGEVDRDPVAGRDPHRDHARGKPARPGGELGIGERSVSGDHKRAVGMVAGYLVQLLRQGADDP